MATTTITLPSKLKLDSWIGYVSAELDAGNDVIFKDSNDNNVNINFIMLGAATNGYVEHRGKEQDDTEKRKLSYVSGGWHSVKIHKIFASGTDSSLYLCVRA